MIELHCTLDRPRIQSDIATEVGCQLELRPADLPAIAGAGELTTNLCLVFDCSASMQGAKTEAAIQAAQLIVNTIDARHRISLVGFATSHWVVVDNASPEETGRDVINSQIDRLRTMIKGSTNLGEGIRRGIQIVHRQQADACVLVVLTDGVADSQADAEAAGIEANAAGVQVCAVGIGEAFRADDLLKVVAPSGGSLLGERAADRLETAFAELLKRIESFVATRVELAVSPAPGVTLGSIYKTSPERMFIGDNADRVVVGNLERGLAYSFQVTLTPPTGGSGEVEIARATLRYDAPSRRMRSAMVEVPIVVSYDSRAEEANPEIVRARARAQLAVLVGQLVHAEERGDRTRSAELLAILVERSAAAGNTQLAELLRGLASPIRRGELNALVLAATARDVSDEPRNPEPARKPSRPPAQPYVPVRLPEPAPPPAAAARPPAPTPPPVAVRPSPTPAQPAVADGTSSTPAQPAVAVRPSQTPPQPAVAAHPSQTPPQPAVAVRPRASLPPPHSADVRLRAPTPSAPMPRTRTPSPPPSEPPLHVTPAPEPAPPHAAPPHAAPPHAAPPPPPPVPTPPAPEPPPPPEPPPVPLHEIVLVEAGPSVIELMRELRELTGFGLARVHELIQSVPASIMRLPEVEARAAKQRLEAHGARVTVAAAPTAR